VKGGMREGGLSEVGKSFWGQRIGGPKQKTRTKEKNTPREDLCKNYDVIETGYYFKNYKGISPTGSSLSAPINLGKVTKETAKAETDLHLDKN